MGQKALIIDVTKCTACFDCFIACKDEFAGQSWLPYSEAQPDEGQYWIQVDEIERGQFPQVKGTFVPKLCMMCEDPLCVKAAKNGAAYKSDDGIVIIDPEKSKGQKQIMTACRYGKIYWNEELDIPQKCTFCAHLIEKGWQQPRCVEVCPARVFTFGDKEELTDLIEKAENFHPEYGTAPAVYYIGLPKTFIAGSIYCNESKDCLENVEVMLFDKETNNTLTANTNNYGDFEFDGLAKGPVYCLNLKAEGYYPITIDSILLDKDISLGNIYLQKMR
ncbi:4Fe-4S dicluster domain-containing protein [Chloroflexota bacterium]